MHAVLFIFWFRKWLITHIPGWY